MHPEALQHVQHRGSPLPGGSVVEVERDVLPVADPTEIRPESADGGQTEYTGSGMRDEPTSHGQTSYGQPGEAVTAKPTVAPVVVLSGSLGSGHDAAAQAVTAALPGRESTTLDCMGLLGRGAGRVGEAVFRRVVAVPPVYDALYFGALRPGGRLAEAMDVAARSRLLPAVCARLPARPALLVAVFATGASTAAAVRREGAAAAAVVVCTDVSAHRLWVHPGIDAYAVTSQAGVASVRRHDPHARVQILPAPIRPQVWQAPTRPVARAALQLDERPCVLLTTGGWGLAPVVEAAVALANRGVQVLAVAGRNPRLYRALCDAAHRQPGLHPLGWTNTMPTCMAAADLVIAPVGASCHEARALGRRLLVLDTMAGHGRDSVQQQLAWGAWVSGPGAAQLVPAALGALAEGTDPPPAQRPQDFPEAFTALLGSLPGAMAIR